MARATIFLAGATLAGDQHGGIRRRDRFDQLSHPLHGRALADQLGLRKDLFEVLFELGHFACGGAMLQRFRNEVHQFVGIERLGDVIVRAILECANRGIHRGIAGHDDHGHFGIDLVQAGLQFDAIDAGHLDIDESQVLTATSEAVESRPRIRLDGHFVVLTLKPLTQGIPDDGVVVNNQDLASGHDEPPGAATTSLETGDADSGGARRGS